MSVLLAAEPSMCDSLQPVHGDLHRENVLRTTSGGVALVDFADLGLGSKWYDFATCLSSLHRLGDLGLCTAFVGGYRSVVPDLPSPQQLSRELLLRDVAIATHLVAHDVREDWVDGRVRGLLRDCQQALVSASTATLPPSRVSGASANTSSNRPCGKTAPSQPGCSSIPVPPHLRVHAELEDRCAGQQSSTPADRDC